MNKLYTRMKTSQVQLAVCSITGIIISLDVPFIPNKVFSYENPLSRIDNAKGIALLPYSTQSKISPHILAGSLLTILTHYELLEDHLSGIERNDFLSSIPPFYLCEAMRFICSQSPRRISLFPRVSFASTLAEFSTPLMLLKNYIEVCNSCLLPSFSPSLNSDLPEQVRISKTKSCSLDPDTKKNFKSLVNDLISTEYLNPKVTNILKLLSQGNNLVTLHDSLRDKLISKLETLESPSASELASILEEVRTSTSTPERAFKQENEQVLDTFSSDLVPLRVKRSLKEILAEKLGKLGKKVEAKKDIKQEILEIISEEEKEEEDSNFNPDEF